MIREPQFENLFYPASAQELRHWLASRLESGNELELPRPPRAFFVPHGSFDFCGDLLAATLRPLRSWAEEPGAARIVILSPALSGCEHSICYPSSTIFRSPLGETRIDEDFISNLSSYSMGFGIDETAHLQEYAIEILLPFLQVLCPRVPIVPLLAAPDLAAKRASSAASAIAAAVAETPGETLYILCANASIPLPEFEASRTAGRILELTKRLDPRSLFEADDPSFPAGTAVRAMGLVLAKKSAAEKLYLAGRGESPKIENSRLVVKYLGFIAY